MALRFSSAKVEKLIGLPTTVKPNQYYLVEFSNSIQLYLSDSKGNLWPLINSGTTNGANINKIIDYIVNQLEIGSVYENSGALTKVTFTLPDIATASNNEEYSFATIDSRLRVVSTGGARIYMGDVFTGIDGAIESGALGSFVCLRAIAGNWVARYLTGQWDLLSLNELVYNGDPLVYNGTPLNYYG